MKGAVITFLKSRRGIALVAGTLLGLYAIVSNGSLTAWAAGAALIILATVVASMAIRISQIHNRINRLPSPGPDTPPADKPLRSTKTGSDDISSERLVRSLKAMQDNELRSDEGQPESDAPSPIVTVVVPCFNDAHFVAQTIQSVRVQSFGDFECLIVDDGSTDDSVRVISAEIEGDPRFRLLRHRVNGGLGAARNTGLRAARSKYVTFLDSDDLLTSESLLDRIMTLYNAERDGFVIGSYCGVRVELEEFDVADLPARYGKNTGKVVDFISADSECPFNAHAPLMVTETVRALGGFNESMRHGAEDWDLWYRALRNGYVFVPSKWTTAVYRQKTRSMVKVMSDGHVREAHRLIAAAFAECENEILRLPTSFPFRDPLPTYREQLVKMKRSVMFATMAMATADAGAAQRILSAEVGLPLGVIKRHVDIESLVTVGLRRALSISPREAAELGGRIQDISRRIEDMMVTEEVDLSVDLPEARPHDVTALLVPQHAGQIQLMLAAAEDKGWAPSDVLTLDVAREGGRQGGTDGLPGHARVMTLNAFALNGGSAKHVVVGSVRDGVTEFIRASMAARGAETLEIPQKHAAVMTIPEVAEVRSNQLSAKGLFGVPGSSDPFIEPTSIWALEEYPKTVIDADEIERFRDLHKGERVVIIGNGPSLNSTDLKKLKSEKTIAVNGIFYATDEMGFDPTYYVVEDTAVMKVNLEAIKAYRAGHKFFPSIYRQMVGEEPNVTYFMMNRGFYEPRSPNYCVPRFSLNPAQCLYSGQSVTIINLQLAYHMGFSEVALIGMDFSYTVPDTAIVEGDIITSTEDDPNHFHPEYFGSGKVWKDPKLDRVLANYALAKEIFEADGRRIVNATVGGNLELFERVDFDKMFA